MYLWIRNSKSKREHTLRWEIVAKLANNYFQFQNENNHITINNENLDQATNDLHNRDNFFDVNSQNVIETHNQKINKNNDFHENQNQLKAAVNLHQCGKQQQSDGYVNHFLNV